MTVAADLIERARDADILALARQCVALTHIATNEWAGPCPGCGGDDRFRLNPKKQTFFCRQCGAKGGGAIDLMMLALGVSFAKAVEELSGATWAPSSPRRPTRAESPPDDQRIRDLKSAARIVSQIGPLIRTPGEDYLRKIRLIDTTAIADVLERTDAIGWHPAVYFNQPDPEREHHELHGQRLGAIIAILTDPITGKPTGAISRTYLRPDLTKIGKAKNLAGSGIVRLSLDEDVLEGLHLAEGLETALYAMAKGFRPLWATGSTSQMAAFGALTRDGVRLDGDDADKLHLNVITRLTILADRDRNEAGERAAKAAADRWREAGRKARVLRLREGLGDLNDVEMRRAG